MLSNKHRTATDAHRKPRRHERDLRAQGVGDTAMCRLDQRTIGDRGALDFDQGGAAGR
jgi:hypothetical protein